MQINADMQGYEQLHPHPSYSAIDVILMRQEYMIVLYLATFLSCVMLGPVNVSIILYYMQQQTPVLDAAHAATFTMVVSQWKTLLLSLNIVAVTLICLPLTVLYRHQIINTKLVKWNLLAAVMFLGISLTTEKDTSNSDITLAGSHVGTSVVGLCALSYMFWLWSRMDDDTRGCGRHDMVQHTHGDDTVLDIYGTVVWTLTYIFILDALAFICTIISYAVLYNQPEKTETVSVVLAYTEYIALLAVSMLYLLCTFRSLGRISHG